MSPPRTAHDRDWLRNAVAQYERPLTSYAVRLLGNLPPAQDVVQDVFLKLCQEHPDHVRDRLGAWLYTVCRNRCFDLQKKERRMNRLSTNHADAQPSREPDQSVRAEQVDEAGSILAVLAQLPSSQREVIRLKVQHGLSYREISDVTGHSVSNVGYLLHIGLQALRARVRTNLSPSSE